MLKRVIIRSNFTAEECENLINNTIADNPNGVISFEMLIENSASLINGSPLVQTTYTLMIQIEEDS